MIADALYGPADAMRRLSGMPEYPFCVTPFPVGNLDPAALDERAQILAGEAAALLSAPDRAAASPTDAPRAHDEELSYPDEDAALADLEARGLTDGLPVVLPTPARVEAMLATTARPESDALVRLDTRNGLTATVRDAAVNAVMAGCHPDQFRLVVAALDAAGDPAYNLHAHTATMAGAQQVLIVDGPVRDQLGLHTGDGALGPGWQPNAAVGRAVRLVLRNALGSVHGQFDRAGFSHPGRYSWCIAEAEEHSPWPPLAVARGAATTGESAVTVYATTWQASVINHDPDAEPLLDELGLAVRSACHVNWLHRDVASDSSFYDARPFLFVTGREHARVLAAGGYGDLDRLRGALFDRMVGSGSDLRPVAVADPSCIQVAYVHATGMQQTWFFAPFQSHHMVTRLVPTR